MFCNCFNPETKKNEITQEELLRQSGIDIDKNVNSYDLGITEIKEYKSLNSNYKTKKKSNLKNTLDMKNNLDFKKGNNNVNGANYRKLENYSNYQNEENKYQKTDDNYFQYKKNSETIQNLKITKKVSFEKKKNKWEKPLTENTPLNLEKSLIKGNGVIENGFSKFSTNFGKNGDRYIYEGEFKNNLFHGKGKENFGDGSIFEGDFRNGVKHGKGCYKFVDFTQYNGDWKKGQFDGFGEYTWDFDKKYLGFWKNGKKHGKGTLVNDGVVFNGNFFDGKKI